MDEIQYINYEEVLDVHYKMTSASDGGIVGVRDQGGIHATLDFIQNDIYYPSFTDKLTYLVFSFCSGHYFNDGNKRIALTLGMYFLYKNDYRWQAYIFMKRFESFVYHIAMSNINQALLLRIMTAFMNNQDYDENLKIDIANAMSRGQRGPTEEN